jgi:hypothetical protein
VPPIFFPTQGIREKNRLPRGPQAARYRAALTLANPDAPANVFSIGERFNLREFIMTISYRILNSYAHPVIEFGGQVYGEEDLCDSIWLIQKELRHGLPKDEQIKAKRQIAHFQTMLDALRAAA